LSTYEPACTGNGQVNRRLACQYFRSQLCVLLIFGEALFHSSRHLSPREQNLTIAAQTLQPDIRTDTHHNPIHAAAWMWLTQADYIVQLDIWEHNDSLMRDP
jgi:hypothetical protein